ncbi:hypothetical protein [Natronorubrum aibiense]|uniref:Uncharacterized protein n=1 Tax=Natronorubrum aibiense TaxID=348826 RepID=A0A5P9P3A3_9EURY|nr:hypothetical protein [Natronorubrum aibiense]QFU82603.1 hypothetical protein GCU68_08755 [Natronorubrum aibiense]
MDKNRSWEYTRQNLRKATKFVEGEYNGINPRQFYRRLKRSLEEIQDGDNFKYHTHGSQEANLDIESENVGELTGTVKGRLVATSEWREIGSGSLTYKPKGPHGALGIIVGLLLTLVGLGDPIIALLGVGLTLAGGYFYMQEETSSFPIHQRDVIRVLITGEVSERTLNTAGESRTDIFANMSVIYAGDAFVAVDTDELDELDWPLRMALVNQVKRWYNQVIDDETKEEEIEEGFVASLKAWSNKSRSDDKQKIASLQQQLLDSSFETRLEYSSLLQDQLPTDLGNELQQHQNELMDELEELADDLEIYVDREGFEESDSQKINN